MTRVLKTFGPNNVFIVPVTLDLWGYVCFALRGSPVWTPTHYVPVTNDGTGREWQAVFFDNEPAAQAFAEAVNGLW